MDTSYQDQEAVSSIVNIELLVGQFFDTINNKLHEIYTQDPDRQKQPVTLDDIHYISQHKKVYYNMLNRELDKLKEIKCCLEKSSQNDFSSRKLKWIADKIYLPFLQKQDTKKLNDYLENTVSLTDSIKEYHSIFEYRLFLELRDIQKRGKAVRLMLKNSQAEKSSNQQENSQAEKSSNQQENSQAEKLSNQQERKLPQILPNCSPTQTQQIIQSLTFVLQEASYGRIAKKPISKDKQSENQISTAYGILSVEEKINEAQAHTILHFVLDCTQHLKLLENIFKDLLNNMGYDITSDTIALSSH